MDQQDEAQGVLTSGPNIYLVNKKSEAQMGSCSFPLNGISSSTFKCGSQLLVVVLQCSKEQVQSQFQVRQNTGP